MTYALSGGLEINNTSRVQWAHIQGSESSLLWSYFPLSRRSKNEWTATLLS